MTQIVIIAAVAENGVIGQGGTMPWRLKSDMAHFKALTAGKPVVMGRKTYDSLHVKPLPRRTNIVVTRDKSFTAPGVLVAASLEAALDAARGDAARRGSDIMVIGGADIYAQATQFADRLEITLVRAKPEGDTRFPAIDPMMWQIVERIEITQAAGDDYDLVLVTYLRRS